MVEIKPWRPRCRSVRASRPRASPS